MSCCSTGSPKGASDRSSSGCHATSNAPPAYRLVLAEPGSALPVGLPRHGPHGSNPSRLTRVQGEGAAEGASPLGEVGQSEARATLIADTDAVILDGEDHLDAGADADLDGGRLRLPDDVAEQFAKCGEQMLGKIRSDDGVNRAVKANARLEPQRGGHLGRKREHANPASGRSALIGLQLEDDAADLPNGRVEIIDRGLDRVGHC